MRHFTVLLLTIKVNLQSKEGIAASFTNHNTSPQVPLITGFTSPHWMSEGWPKQIPIVLPPYGCWISWLVIFMLLLLLDVIVLYVIEYQILWLHFKFGSKYLWRLSTQSRLRILYVNNYLLAMECSNFVPPSTCLWIYTDYNVNYGIIDVCNIQ